MKSGMIYLVLVGLPVLALLGVVRVGAGITPPPYVGGAWHVTPPADTPPGPGCQPPGASAPVRLEVVQSGTVLELAFAGTPPVRLDARLGGDVLRTTRPGGEPACAPGWELDARIVRREGQARMTGQWQRAGCDRCAPVPFAATRLDAPETTER